MHQSGVRPLLARNIRKRLLIGIGVELLLKSAFLKAGYAINKPVNSNEFRFPSRFELIGDKALDKVRTATFSECLRHIGYSMKLQCEQATRDGLEIAHVFRNKEAHGIVSDHPYCADTYKIIEDALKDVYRCAFSEALIVKIGMTAEDEPIWNLNKIAGLVQQDKTLGVCE